MTEELYNTTPDCEIVNTRDVHADRETVFRAWTRYSKPLFQIAASFDEISKNITRLTFKMLFSNAEECNKLKGFAPEKNEENLDRLEEEIKRMTKHQ